MNARANKMADEIRKEQELTRSLELQTSFKKAILTTGTVAMITALLTFAFVLHSRRSGEMQFDAGSIFLALFLVVPGIITVRKIHDYLVLNEPGCDLLYSPGMFTTGLARTTAERTTKNLKSLYNASPYLWPGLFLIAIVILVWLQNINGPSNNYSNAKIADNGKIDVDLLQVNDVYEIAGLDNASVGGMARVAALKKQFLRSNKNTLLLMAGDFLSPSVFNSIKINRRNLAGEQMIAAMNSAGVDLAIFGNHEFDLGYTVLQQRIDESSFQWIASNTYYTTDSGRTPFKKNNEAIPGYWKKTFSDEDGTSLTLGFMGLTVPGNIKFATFDSTLVAAKKLYAELAPQCDGVIAVTHQDLSDDKILARAIPGLLAIIGGHEHDMQFEKVGNVIITKAHSNARSVFHLRITSDIKQEPKLTVTPELIKIDASIQPDFLTKSTSDKWMETALEYFRDSGFSPEKVICNNFNSTLDGRDISTRTKKTNLTRLITDAMLAATKIHKTELAIMNSGSIRIDDHLEPPVTEYTILRALPYGGATRVARMKGFFIKALLDSAAQLATDGAFLQYSDNLNRSNWKLNNSKTITDSNTYTVAIADYLIEGRQEKLTYVNKNAMGVDTVYRPPTQLDSSMYDIRKAVINFIRNGCKEKNFLERYK